MDEKIISFPHLGDYHIPIEYLLSHITDATILPPPPITKKTLEIGTKHSPDFVCIPFKYNLGNYIEALDKGANIIVQAGGGCRFGYYGEIQEKILRDMGYQFEFITLLDSGKTNLKKLYHKVKQVNPNCSLFKFLYHFFITIRMVNYMDNIDKYIRENIGFEVVKNSFLKLKRKMLRDFKQTTGIIDLNKKYKYYKKKFQSLKINKPNDCLKIGIIGELYTAMEPSSTYYLEQELAKMNIQITRFTNVTYLLFQKRFHLPKMLRSIKEYDKYNLGADGSDNVYRAKLLAKKGYDGLIHTKPFGCTPEVAAIPLLRKVSNDYHIPIMYFSFDSIDSEVGLKTRLEAFYDMLMMKRRKQL